MLTGTSNVLSKLYLSNTTFQKLDTYLKERTDNDNFSGAVLIAHKGKILFKQGYGYANRETAEYNTPDTAFRIASITKMFTAVAILKLQEQDELRVNNTLNMYIHDYPYGNKITIHHLLSMTSGIPNILSFVEQTAREKTIILEQLIRKIKKQSLEFEPGTQFNYSNSNYILLAYIIEKISGMSYAEYLMRYIFEPLKMYNSYVDDGTSKSSQAIGYSFDLNQILPAKPYDMSWSFGAGNIRSTVNDLYLFDKALRNGILLTNDSCKLMQSAIIKTDWVKIGWGENQNESAYGYGLIITPTTQDREATIGHSGGIGVFSSEITHFSTSDITLIILINCDSFRSSAKAFLTRFETIIFGKYYTI